MKTVRISRFDFVDFAQEIPEDGTCRIYLLRGCGTVNGETVFGKALLAAVLAGQPFAVRAAREPILATALTFPAPYLPGALHTPVALPDPDEALVRYYQVTFDLLATDAGAAPVAQTLSALSAWILAALPREDSPTRRLTEQAKQIIRRDYATDLTLKAVAAELFVNPSYLSTVFHRVEGCTFCKYLTRVRLAHVCRLLTQSNYLVSDIAMQVGFNSSAYLISIFRKEYGLTPNAYRAMYTL